jgi:hypothetical protein
LLAVLAGARVLVAPPTVANGGTVTTGDLRLAMKSAQGSFSCAMLHGSGCRLRRLLMRMDVKSYVGAGVVRLGMGREAVRAAMGAAHTCFMVPPP